jgi:hypothetical protein
LKPLRGQGVVYSLKQNKLKKGFFYQEKGIDSGNEPHKQQNKLLNYYGLSP